jgi:hypothetical protein
MEAVETEGLTFEKVLAMFQETDKKIQEVTLQMKETDRKIGKLGNRIGDLIEHFAAGNILGKFQKFGFTFNLISQNMIIEDRDRRSVAEVDLYLENGEDIMIVEVKTNLNRSDVKEHLKRMDTLRAWADTRGGTHRYLGAIAVAFAGKAAREYALSSGFFLVEQQGDNVKITAPENKRVW